MSLCTSCGVRRLGQARGCSSCERRGYGATPVYRSPPPLPSIEHSGLRTAPTPPPTAPREASEAWPEDALGREVGGYRLRRVLGRGGMASVYLGERIQEGRRAAIKILRSAYAADQELVRRFLGEARLLRRLRHASIVEVYDYGFAPGIGYFLSMEYLEGESLKAYVGRRGALPAPEAVALGGQILGALEAAHRAGVIHRDLKPENIFLLPRGGGHRVKLLDFGIAKLPRDRTREAIQTLAGFVLGTPAYMAPEQAAGSGEIDGRADLYAFGVILFELLTGRRPFLSQRPRELMLMHLIQPPPRPSTFVPDLPRPLEDLILCCLQKDPAARASGATSLRADLEAIGRALAPATRATGGGDPDVAPRTLEPAAMAGIEGVREGPDWPWIASGSEATQRGYRFEDLL